MRHATTRARTTRRNGNQQSNAIRNHNSVSIAPPKYGIDFVDRAAASATPSIEPGSTVSAIPSHTVQSAPVQRKENAAGLPEPLKAGIESLSGLSMDDVRVHGNSPEPARLWAAAYTQGNDIHLGPGQERHLPHEAWHVVQQMQGRVKPTLQAKGVPVNDETALEHEADAMGTKALHIRRSDLVNAGPEARVATAQRKRQTTEAFEAPDATIGATGEKVRLNSLTTGRFHNPASNNTLSPLQLMSWEDLVYLQEKETIGLRHVRPAHNKKGQEQITEGVSGDAVPLKPELAIYNHPKDMNELIPEMTKAMTGWNVLNSDKGSEDKRKGLIDKFGSMIRNFIAMELGFAGKPKENKIAAFDSYVDRLAKQEFLLPTGMGGYKGPPSRDIDKPEYAGLGKFGRQEISKEQFKQTKPIKLTEQDVDDLKEQVLSERLALLKNSEEGKKGNKEGVITGVLQEATERIYKLIAKQVSAWRMTHKLSQEKIE